MGWKRLDLGANAADLVKASFTAAFARGGAPHNAALFEVASPRGVQLYFSPAAAALFDANLQALASKRSAAPPAGARLIVGDPKTWGGA